MKFYIVNGSPRKNYNTGNYWIRPLKGLKTH